MNSPGCEGRVTVSQDSKRNRRGRPTIGGVTEVRLGDLLPEVDDFAAEIRQPRAEATRRLIEAGLRVRQHAQVLRDVGRIGEALGPTALPAATQPADQE